MDVIHFHTRGHKRAGYQLSDHWVLYACTWAVCFRGTFLPLPLVGVGRGGLSIGIALQVQIEHGAKAHTDPPDVVNWCQRGEVRYAIYLYSNSSRNSNRGRTRWHGIHCLRQEEPVA